jgi:hypothetical protein
MSAHNIYPSISTTGAISGTGLIHLAAAVTNRSIVITKLIVTANASVTSLVFSLQDTGTPTTKLSNQWLVASDKWGSDLECKFPVGLGADLNVSTLTGVGGAGAYYAEYEVR